MRRSAYKFLAVVLLTAVLFAATTRTAPLAARVDTLTGVAWSCNNVHASGTFSSGSGGAKYVKLFVFADTGGGNFVEIASALIGGGTPSGNYGGSVGFAELAPNTTIYVDISTYDISNATFADWDGEQFFYGFVNCSAGPGYGGPPIPQGSEQKRILCDVAVFDMPGGNPVGANRLLNGQVWYVMPDVYEAADGTDWKAVFVSGYNLGYVPARCVEGYVPKAVVAKPAVQAPKSVTTSTAGFQPSNVPVLN